MATIIVNTFEDETDGSITDGTISLRDAIAAASEGDRITFAEAGYTGLELGALVLVQGVTIDGDLDDDGVADVTVDAQGMSRAFTVTGREVVLDGLMITGGYSYGDTATAAAGGGILVERSAELTILGSALYGNYATGAGGGLYSLGETTVVDSEVVENASLGGGGGLAAGEGTLAVLDTIIGANFTETAGGGIALTGDATLIADGLMVAENDAIEAGGGLAIDEGSLAIIEGSDIVGNTSETGGGIANAGEAFLDGTRVAENSAVTGGGIVNTGTLTLVRSTLAENTAEGEGGGILNAGPDAVLALVSATLADNAAETGAGLANDNGEAVLINATIAGNAAGEVGGGVANLGGNLQLTHVTLTGNIAEAEGGGVFATGATFVADSILLGNAAGSDAEVSGDIDFEGTNIVGADPESFDAEGYDNVIQAATGEVFAAVADLFGVPAGVLEDNGGAVPTVALLAAFGNPAVNAASGDLPEDEFDLDGDGDTDEDLPLDARDSDRETGATPFTDDPDLGAVEVQPDDFGVADLEIVLVDADTDEIIGPLEDGDQFLASTLDGRDISIAAFIPQQSPFFGLVESMQVVLNDGDETQTENVEPYTLFGNSGENYFGDELPLGDNRVTFNLYSNNNLNGSFLGTVTRDFTIVDDISVGAPTVTDDTLMVFESDDDGEIDIFANDEAAAGEELMVFAVGSSASDLDDDDVDDEIEGSNGGIFEVDEDGEVSFDADGQFEFLGAGETATTSIAVEIGHDDADGDNTAISTLTVTVTGENDAPEAEDIDVTVAQGESVSIDVLGSVTDPDATDTLSIASLTDPESGTVQIVDGEVVYTADDDFTGTDSFEFTVSDGNGGTDTATVMVQANCDNAMDGVDIGLYDATSDDRIQTLTGNDVIFTSSFTSSSLTIAADIDESHVCFEDVESARLTLNNGDQVKVENFEPFALFGDINRNFDGGSLPEGESTLVFEFYSEDEADGELLATVVLDFTIVDDLV
ncbi:MAG: Ig-like domain-containing protein [Pseudomonadota bacterium]